jgi:diacylglycerol kinase
MPGQDRSTLQYILQTQRRLPFYLLAIAIIVALGLWLGLAASRWAVLVFLIALLVVAKLMNIIGEAILDLLGAERHPLAKAARDVSVGALFVVILATVVVGLLVLGPPLLARLGL